MNDSSGWEIQKNTIFQDTIFDLYTQPQPIAYSPCRNSPESNKTCQKKGKFGVKGWYLPTSGSIWYKRQYKNLSLSLCLARNSSFTNPSLWSAVWGPRTSDLSSLPTFSISQPGPRHLSVLYHFCDNSFMSVKCSGDERGYC